MTYTFNFSGQIVVEADTEEKAYAIADDILGTTPYQFDHEVTIDDIELIDED